MDFFISKALRTASASPIVDTQPHIPSWETGVHKCLHVSSSMTKSENESNFQNMYNHDFDAFGLLPTKKMIFFKKIFWKLSQK